MAGFVIRKKQLSSFQIIIFGFAGLIVFGTLLLMLPFATRSGESASFIDAAFTSTSAVCVTGLIVHDTATFWSPFGQFIIMTLIQIGGLGVITVAAAIAKIAGRRITLMQRSTMQEAISAPKVGGIVRFTSFIVKAAVIIEFLGAALMSPVFIRDFGVLKGIWYSVFHSVSAFCNAGFDLMGAKAPFSSLTIYNTEPLINITIMMLIVIGGLGFLTWDDIAKNRFHLRQYRMQSKVILCTTAILILLPALYFFFSEFSSQPMGSRIFSSMFQAITPRTAGFNTVDLHLVSDASIGVMMALMLIGGSPGSTAGGMKTTTFAVLFMTAAAVFRRKEHTNCFGRRLSDNTLRNAAAIFLLYIVLFLTGAMLISGLEGLPLTPCLFETASAVGTVGLSMGITTKLSVISRLILMALMFFGRAGGLTLIFATVSGTKKNVSLLPEERITVG